MEVVTRWWLAFADAVGSFIEELIFRVVLARDVIVGRVPQRVDKRFWNRSTETPVLVDVYDWTNERLIFSVLVWPPLESGPGTAERDHRQRVEEVLEAIAKGAAEKLWSTRWEVSELAWDHKRECWVDGDGIAYDAARLYEYSRQGGGWHSRCLDVRILTRIPRNASASLTQSRVIATAMTRLAPQSVSATLLGAARRKRAAR